jgi:SAM-dependent methyltransferase
MRFICNICGKEQENSIFGRETPSCFKCHSTSRWRALIHSLSLSFFCESFPLTEFPIDKKIKGIGLSDAELYAKLLSKKLDYKNTFYHKRPYLDIMKIPDSFERKYDFLISSDVLEHVPPPVSNAFRNSFRLLKPGGVMIFSAPYVAGHTIEHFPGLNEYKIKRKLFGGKVLVNRMESGNIQKYEKLKFHGGEGSTLEMRYFGELDLLNEFCQAGFVSISYCYPYPKFGIIWDEGRRDSLIISARRQA